MKKDENILDINEIELAYKQYKNIPIDIEDFNRITENIASKYYSKVNPFTHPEWFYSYFHSIDLPMLISFNKLTQEFFNDYDEIENIDEDGVILFDVISLFPSEYVISVYFTFDFSTNKLTIINCSMEC